MSMALGECKFVSPTLSTSGKGEELIVTKCYWLCLRYLNLLNTHTHTPLYLYRRMYVCVYICLYVLTLWLVYATWPKGRDSIPGRVLPKTQRLVLDSSLLNTQPYTVQIKGKWSNTGKLLAPLTSPCSSYWNTSLRVAQLVYIYIYIYIYICMYIWQLSIGYRSYGSQTWPTKWNAVSSKQRLCRYCCMDALHER